MNEKKFHVGIKALIINDSNKILLLKTSQKQMEKVSFAGKNDSDDYWDIPGGRMKEDETIDDTLKNEIKEELNIDLTCNIAKKNFYGYITPVTIKQEDQKFGLVLLVFVIRTKIRNEDIKLNHEHSEYRWVSINETKKLLNGKFSQEFIDKLNEL